MIGGSCRAGAGKQKVESKQEQAKTRYDRRIAGKGVDVKSEEGVELDEQQERR